MLAILREQTLPLDARPLLDIAERYWRGEASPDELAAAKTACWTIIDGFPGGSSDTSTRPRRNVRALLCVLGNPADDEALSMTVEWFVVMIDQGPTDAAEGHGGDLP